MIKIVEGILLVLFSITIASGNDLEYENALAQLEEGNSDKDISAALLFFAGEKEKAFPFLLTKLKSNELASSRHFQKSEIIRNNKTGEFITYHPRIGDVAFDLIRGAIEGHRTKGEHHLYVLNRNNITAWMEDHKDLSLREMRVAVRQSRR